MFNPNVFGSPARKLHFYLSRSPRTDQSRSDILAAIKVPDGCTMAVAAVEAPQSSDFLQSRTQWCQDEAVPAVLFDPILATDFAEAVREEYRLTPNITDFGLGDTEFECGDEVVIVYPQRTTSRRPGEQSLEDSYCFDAVRIGHPQCLSGAAGEMGEMPEDLLDTLFGMSGASGLEGLLGGRGQRSRRGDAAPNQDAIKISISIPQAMVGTLLAMLLRLLLSRQGFGGMNTGQAE